MPKPDSPRNVIDKVTELDLESEQAAGVDVIEVSGTIKWFDDSKGYGFIDSDDGRHQVLLHITALRRDGYQTAYEGARVVCEAVRGPKGLQAFRIVSMDETSATHPAQIPARTHVTVVPTSDYERWQVKWFNRLRGYGFLTSAESTEDIFVHLETLRQYGFTELRPGQTVLVRYGHSPKGLVAAELKPCSEHQASGQQGQSGTPTRKNLFLLADVGGSGAALEENTNFDIILTGFGDEKINVIKQVRAITGLGLKEARALVEGAPKPVKEAVSKDEAEEISGRLKEVGAATEIRQFLGQDVGSSIVDDEFTDVSDDMKALQEDEGLVDESLTPLEKIGDVSASPSFSGLANLEAEQWLAANLVSLQREAADRSASMDKTLAYVQAKCAAIRRSMSDG